MTSLNDCQQLTSDGRFKLQPLVWPDGKSVVFTGEVDAGRLRLLRLTLAQSRVELLHPDQKASERSISVSADGQVLAFNTGQHYQWSIIIDDKKRSRHLELKGPADANWSTDPVLAPDAFQLVFAHGVGPLLSFDLRKDHGKSTFTHDETIQGAATLLTTKDKVDHQKFGDRWPAFSPDGKQIAFTSRRDNDFEIYLMNADGSDQRRLTRNPGLDVRPAFSPDGKTIAFTSNREGSYAIYLMNADGSNPRRLTSGFESCDYACWHPDGQRLLFVGERNGRFDLYLFQARTG